MSNYIFIFLLEKLANLLKVKYYTCYISKFKLF